MGISNYQTALKGLVRAFVLVIPIVLSGCAATTEFSPPAAPEVLQDCTHCPVMVVLPVGEFLMGAAQSEPGATPDEHPQARQSISSRFAIGLHEVTVSEFAAFVIETGYETETNCRSYRGGYWYTGQSNNLFWSNPGFFQDRLEPVVCVNWHDANAYTDWLSQETGELYRLPTEAEWEFAARAGTTTRFWFGDEDNDICRYGNIRDLEYGNRNAPCSDQERDLTLAGSFEPNGFGLYGIIGNASEWVEDCWSETYSPEDVSAVSALGDDCRKRVFRGGSWWHRPSLQRSAERGSAGPGLRNFYIGFRVARDVN